MDKTKKRFKQIDTLVKKYLAKDRLEKKTFDNLVKQQILDLVRDFAIQHLEQILRFVYIDGDVSLISALESYDKMPVLTNWVSKLSFIGILAKVLSWREIDAKKKKTPRN